MSSSGWCSAAVSVMHLSLLKTPVSWLPPSKAQQSAFPILSLALLVLAGPYPDPSAYIRPFLFFAPLVICRPGCLLQSRMSINGQLLMFAALLHLLKFTVFFLLGLLCFVRWFFIISGSSVWSSFNCFSLLLPFIQSKSMSYSLTRYLVQDSFQSEYWRLWWGLFFLVLYFWLIFPEPNRIWHATLIMRLIPVLIQSDNGVVQ